jgi:copper chaperone CopZ
VRRLPVARRARRVHYDRNVAQHTETLQVSGIRCERCVGRLADALQGHAGLAAAHANLMGQVQLTYDDEVTSRDEVLAVMARAGFREIAAV